MTDIGTFYGMKILQSPLVTPVPVVQISPDFKWCSDELRCNLNAWLLETLGTKEVIYRVGKDTVIMSPRHFNFLKMQGYVP